MSNTTNYNLQTWSSSEASTDSFNNFLFGTAGDENSNMTKIDQQLKLNADNSLLSLQQPIRILNATKSSTSYYTATIANYSSYSNGNLFYLVLDNDSEDTLTLNINSYGTRSVMKIKPDGTLYNISAGDIIHGYPNLIQYDGTQWLLLDVKNLSQVGTNISGLLKGSNGQIVQATAGVDYPTVNMGLPTGGVQNDFLIKSSTTNYESEWKKIYGSNISVSESDAQTIDTALSAIGSRTGADIPVSGTDATKIDAALAGKQETINSDNAAIVRTALELGSGAIKDIQAGNFTVTVAAGNYVDTTVTFSPAFANAPAMSGNIGNASAASYTRIGISPSAASAVVRVYNEATTEKTLTVLWIAVSR